MNLQELKVVFFGTAEFAVPILNMLLESTNVIALVTQPDRPVGRKQELQSPPVKSAVNSQRSSVTIFQFEDLKSDEVFDQLTSLNADIFIVAAYGRIIPKRILDLPRFKSLNVHGSRLPQYRGASPIHQALIDGLDMTGNSIIVMDDKMDHGPILAQSEVVIAPDDDFPTLRDKMAVDGADLLKKTLEQYINNEIQLKEQDHERATYVGLIKKEDGVINWAESAEQIYNKWRAYREWPGIVTIVGNDLRLRLDKIVVAERSDLQPGKSKIENERIFIGAGNNTSIEVLKLTPAGKRTMSAEEYVRGVKGLALN